MDRDLRILVNTADKLVIQSPPRGIPTFVIIVTICLLSFLVYKLWTTSTREAAIGVIVIAIPVSWLVYVNNKNGYQMELNRIQNTVVVTPFTGTTHQHFFKSNSMPLDHVERADMEFDRNFRRITLSTRSGTLVHPLGPNYEVMDSQFIALGLIQSFIERGPYQAPHTLDSPR